MHSVLLGLILGPCASGLSIPKPLRFTNNGTFQISLFSDLHYGEAEDLDWGPQQDINSTRVMNTILDVEDPQLVVLNGDLITGENTFKHNSTSYVDIIVKPLVARGLSWASTYGNHDSQFNLSRQELFECEKQYPNSLTQRMVWARDSGVSNYFLPVYSSDETDMVPQVILWFFDSRGGAEYQREDDQGNGVPISDYVSHPVVNWFKDTNKALTRLHGRTIPSLAFVHIPTTAMLAFQQGPGVDKNREPGINDDNPLAAQGPSDGSLNYSGQDKPFMRALVETPGLIAVFSGHDHGDDWCFKWNASLPGMDIQGNGVDLCFDRHSGYGGYGTWTRGSRQVLLDQHAVESLTRTWVRLEDKSISGAVMLNSTYGRDEYPVVLDTYT